MKEPAIDINGVIRLLIIQAEADDDIYFEYCRAIALIFPNRLIPQLKQLADGPIWDGDIISKSDRGELFDMGIAIRVCCKGEQGYTGAKYIAHTILYEYKKIESKENRKKSEITKKLVLTKNEIEVAKIDRGPFPSTTLY